MIIIHVLNKCTGPARKLKRKGKDKSEGRFSVWWLCRLESLIMGVCDSQMDDGHENDYNDNDAEDLAEGEVVQAKFLAAARRRQYDNCHRILNSEGYFSAVRSLTTTNALVRSRRAPGNRSRRSERRQSLPPTQLNEAAQAVLVLGSQQQQQSASYSSLGSVDKRFTSESCCLSSCASAPDDAFCYSAPLVGQNPEACDRMGKMQCITLARTVTSG